MFKVNSKDTRITSIKARHKIFSFNVLMHQNLYEGLIERIVTLDICCLLKNADTVMKFGIDNMITQKICMYFSLKTSVGTITHIMKVWRFSRFYSFSELHKG